MNKFQKFLFGAASLFMLAGCSDDFGNNGNSPDTDRDGAGVYMGVSFKMPGKGVSTRSFTEGDNTSNNGTEVGKDVENNVNEVLLILARPNDYGFIGAASVLKDNILQHSGNTSADNGNAGAYHATAKFQKTELNSFYSDTNIPDSEKGKVAVFVIVNPTGGMADALENAHYGDTEWINTGWTVNVDGQQTEGSIWTNTNGGSFLMTNTYIATRQLPTKMSDWDQYTNEDNCFHLSEMNTNVGGTSTINNSNVSTDNTNSTGGPVLVQRCAARFDFRDGHLDAVDHSGLENESNRYHVVYEKNADGTNGDLLIDVKLYKMALVNMSKTFYYLSRVSNNGLNSGTDWKLCGPEKPWFESLGGGLLNTGNYVVDTDAQMKFDGAYTQKGFKPSQYYNYPFFNEDGTIDNANLQNVNDRWSTVVLDELLKSDVKDNWNNNGNTGTYTIWRYATENTIPGVDIQDNGISTGMVFKGKMIPSENMKNPNAAAGTKEYYRNQLYETLSNTAAGDTDKDPILYSYAGSLYYTWNNVYAAAIEASFSYQETANGIIPTWNRTNSLYKAVFGSADKGTGYQLIKDGKVLYSDPLPIDDNAANTKWQQWNAAGKPGSGSTLHADFKKAVTDAGITIYQRSFDTAGGWGYWCYYYYWNRHNDNGKNGIMGPMEFAVVRNNVYKLAVTEIKKLGHPRISENDPDKPTPGTPDETSDIYLTVDAKVIPWVVRVNNIVFE